MSVSGDFNHALEVLSVEIAELKKNRDDIRRDPKKAESALKRISDRTQALSEMVKKTEFADEVNKLDKDLLTQVLEAIDDPPLIQMVGALQVAASGALNDLRNELDFIKDHPAIQAVEKINPSKEA